MLNQNGIMLNQSSTDPNTVTELAVKMATDNKQTFLFCSAVKMYTMMIHIIGDIVNNFLTTH